MSHFGYARPLLRGTALCSLLLAAGSAAVSVAAPGAAGPPALTERQKIAHALNRLGFGPRPGDVEAVRKMGLHRWVEQQLEPAKIDDSAVEAKLARLSDLQLAPADLMAAYTEDQAAARQARLARLRQQGSRDGAAALRRTANQPPGIVQLPRRVPRSVQTLGELADEKIIRACESSRQLQEVLVDFWSNHFSVDAKKGPVRTFVVGMERDAVRPHVFGRFRDLLEAVAKSPAMLFYLDNASSTRDFSDPSTAPPGSAGRRLLLSVRRPKASRARTGLNENYARELMELHTLGVDGGYTQKDVQEVARCLTGWSIDRATGEFRFYPFRHDFGAKVVLGHQIPAGRGIEDGEEVLDILASHPSTARSVSRKLCMRFVSDDPPSGLVDRAAHTFVQTQGDLRAVVRSIATSPELFAPAAYRAKVKSPFEYAVSAVRALGGTIEIPDMALPRATVMLAADGAASLSRGRVRRGPRGATTLARAVASLGEPLYGHEAPTGYPDDSREWPSTGALLTRMNFAVALTAGRVQGVTIPDSGLPSPGTLGPRRTVLGVDLSRATYDAIRRSADGLTPSQVSALVLGSPEFQRR